MQAREEAWRKSCEAENVVFVCALCFGVARLRSWVSQEGVCRAELFFGLVCLSFFGCWLAFLVCVVFNSPRPSICRTWCKSGPHVPWMLAARVSRCGAVHTSR